MLDTSRNIRIMRMKIAKNSAIMNKAKSDTLKSSERHTLFFVVADSAEKGLDRSRSILSLPILHSASRFFDSIIR